MYSLHVINCAIFDNAKRKPTQGYVVFLTMTVFSIRFMNQLVLLAFRTCLLLFVVTKGFIKAVNGTFFEPESALTTIMRPQFELT